MGKVVDIFKIEANKRLEFYTAVNKTFTKEIVYLSAERKFMSNCGATHRFQSTYTFKSKNKYVEFVFRWL